MELFSRQNEKNTLYIAVLTLVVLGLGLVLSTWHMLRQQEESGLEHLGLTARSVLQAVDVSLRRGSMQQMGRNRFQTDTREFFQDLQTNSDVLFAGLLDEKGNRFPPARVPQDPLLVLPPQALEELRTDNRWQGVALYDGSSAYVAARRLRMTRANPHEDERQFRQDHGPQRHGMQSHDQQLGPENPTQQDLFLAVALDMSKNRAVYHAFRRTALFQTAYTLAAALFLWVLTARFFSRRKHLEKSLAEAEKLAAVGALAAGVAHEIRNPLSALRGFAQYFAKKLAGKKPEEEYAATMVREADRLNRVVTDLLYLSKPRAAAPVATDLRHVCDELAALLHFELQEKNLILDLKLTKNAVKADPDGLKQALLNLLLNALEAMPPNEGPARAVTVSSEADAGRNGVWVRVADSGPGMTEEQRKQAFEPFVSTKDKGTGLGLALVRSIVLQHGGEAAIRTAPGQGCEVGLFFPGTAELP